MNLQSKGIADIAELDSALTELKQSGSRTLIVQPSPLSFAQRGRIIASAMKNGMGTIFAFPIAASEGSLIAYGIDYLYMYGRAPVYVDRILKGTKPADLPVEQPTKVELVINMRTAKLLGLKVPTALFAGATEVIE
jgi:putative ABC transport system substrate-binding protein